MKTEAHHFFHLEFSTICDNHHLGSDATRRHQPNFFFLVWISCNESFVKVHFSLFGVTTLKGFEKRYNAIEMISTDRLYTFVCTPNLYDFDFWFCFDSFLFCFFLQFISMCDFVFSFAQLNSFISNPFQSYTECHLQSIVHVPNKSD